MNINLQQCNTSAEVLDWIMQLIKHCWYETKDEHQAMETLGYLVHAINDLLYPQNNLCSMGQHHTMDVIGWLTRTPVGRDKRYTTHKFPEDRQSRWRLRRWFSS